MVAGKRIADPVHDTIALSPLEVSVISTRAFQRLRGVKQLGLAYLVFPGADYSRFSHCVGVCHVTKLILESLRRSVADLSDEEEQKYRVAALLHDVGHYPFSHSMERAIKNFYAEALLEPVAGGPPAAGTQPSKTFDHERLGKEIVIRDDKLSGVLKNAGFDPSEIARIFLREKPPRFANLISSDLDADRIDYLLRTALHTGLPYGNVDLPYLLSQMGVDNENRIALKEKALATADHFLLCRYFDYQTVSFHKTVAALELLLEDVLSLLLKNGLIDCSADALRGRIDSGAWPSFDDAFILERIRALADNAGMADEARKARALLGREGPKLVGEIEYLNDREQATRNTFLSFRQMVDDHIEGWADEFGIPLEDWYIWDRHLELTKVGSHVPVSAARVEVPEGDPYEQAVRILNEAAGDSAIITEVPNSLMKALSNSSLYTLRIYALVPPGGADRQAVQSRISTDLPLLPWK